MSGKPKKNISTIQQQPKPIKGEGKKEFSTEIPKWAPIAVLIFTALLYSKALQNGFTGFDDDFYVTKNQMLYDFSWNGIKVIFTSLCYYTYHPITILLYLFEYKWFGLNPIPYHALNVMLHLINTWLVFKLTEQLSGKKLTALIVSVLFAVHPMHVESVAWVSELKDVLYALFYLSSLLFYLRYMEAGFHAKYYLLALFLFVLSLLSKPAAVTLPVLLIAIDMYKGRKLNTRLLLEKAPFLLLSLLFGIMTMVTFKAGGAMNDNTASYGFINKIFLASYALQSYLVRALIPYGLTAMHHFPPLHDGYLPWRYYTSLPFVLLIAMLVIRRSSLRKEMVFGVFFFLIAISVMLQIISFSSHLYAERYTYLAYIGLFYIAGQWISKVGIIKWRNIVIGLCTLLVIVYSAQTWARIGTWKDSMTLFSDMVDKEPDIYFGYFVRGNAEKSEGNLQAAIEDYNTAIRLNPDFEDLYYNRGTLFDASGNFKSAMLDYSSSIRLNPKMPDAYNNRGWAFFRSGDTTAALQDLSKAISLKPEYAEAYNNRGWVYFQSGNTKMALSDFNKAILLNPGFDKPLYNRAALKGNTGNFPGALEDFNILLKLHPDDNATWYYRGMTYLMLKDTSAACNDFKKANDLGNEAASKMIRQYCH